MVFGVIFDRMTSSEGKWNPLSRVVGAAVSPSARKDESIYGRATTMHDEHYQRRRRAKIKRRWTKETKQKNRATYDGDTSERGNGAVVGVEGLESEHLIPNLTACEERPGQRL